MSKTTIDVAIVGAGVAGLAAARALEAGGLKAVVYEKAALPGGRLATDYHAGCAFDYGAQNIKADATAIAPFLAAALAHDAAAIIPGPVCLHDKGQILPGDQAANREAKYAGRHGLAGLAHLLAAGLGIRYQTPVRTLTLAPDGYELRDESGTLLGSAPHVVLTLPAPEAADLLQNSHLEGDNNATQRIEILQSVNYSRCLTVSLQYDFPSALPFYALLARDRAHPLLWLANESAKPGNGTATSFVAQLGQAVSAELWDAPQARIMSATVGWIVELLGERYLHPSWHQTRHWRYAQPLNPASFETVNPPGTRLLICGDGIARGRVPDAYASGLQAAARVIETRFIASG